ncbi:catechol 1,2-dioxygenase [Microbacterium lushaniae]|nr:catechol 1,2-dioxygenase [Microbacterium lushaniae]KAA9151587.1 catechol 1,2-dioxygenase [Microbacterium lushaniae]
MTSYDPGPRIAHAGSIDLGVTDLDQSLAFFSDLLGMEVVARTDDGVAYLRGYQELVHHSLVLTQQDEARVNSYSFRVQRPQDVELFRDELEQQDIEVLELPSGHEIGRGTAIRFLTPFSEHPFEFYYDIDKPLAPEGLRSRLPTSSSRRRGLGARRLDHFNIQTSPGTMNQAERWLQDAMGLKRREYIMMPDHPTTLLASWMSVTSQMHDVALGVNRLEQKAQLHHVAFNLENYHDVLTAADRIRDLDIEWGVGPGKHGVGQAMYLYVHDPGSGHRIELYSGGYHVFDPDWEPVLWELENIPHGMTWYGEAIDVSPGSRGRATTPSAGLRD